MSDPKPEPEARPELEVPCEVYSRIVGYLRPVQNWHQGKQQEFRERRTFRVPDDSPQPTEHGTRNT